MALFRHSKTMQINPWLIHVNVWQKPLQYCNVISLQRIKINEKKKSQGKRRMGQSPGKFRTQSFRLSLSVHSWTVFIFPLMMCDNTQSITSRQVHPNVGIQSLYSGSHGSPPPPAPLESDLTPHDPKSPPQTTWLDFLVYPKVPR